MSEYYPHQAADVAQVRALFRAGRKRVLLQAATGYGKTFVTGKLVKSSVSKGNRVWFCVHRRELVNQVCRAFDAEGIDYGVISADYDPKPKALAQIVSVQTAVRRLDRLAPPDLLVLDEAHHVASRTWEALIKHCAKAYHLGLSATPRRLDGAGLRPYFDDMVAGPSMKWLIENSFLSPYRLFAPTTLDMEGVSVIGREFNRKEAAKRVTDSKIVGDAVEHYRKHCDMARAVVFAVSVEHAQQVAAKFRDAGVPSTFFDGNTEKGLRDQINRDFASGHIRVLCNCELLGEGYDLPAIEAAILLRPTMSVSLYLQQVGRALRFVPGKVATILDHVGNSARHGMPDDERTWTLDIGGARTKKEARPSPRICTKCFAASRPTATICETCQNPFESEARVIDEEAGELAEVAPLTEEQLAKLEEQRKKARDQGMAKSLDQLVALAKMRYNHPQDKAERWANYILDGRNKKAAKMAAGK